MTHDAPGAWWPDLDHAVGGIATTVDRTVEGAADTVGDALGGVVGGASRPLANFMLTLAAIVAAAYVLARWA